MIVSVGPRAVGIGIGRVMLALICRPRRERIRNYRYGTIRNGVLLAPEVGLPPGFALPSVALRCTAPKSFPPLTSLPPTAEESRRIAADGVQIGDGGVQHNVF
ncbi:MAG TPA: hypothetical protein VGG54_22545 [Trebonia sp.]